MLFPVLSTDEANEPLADEPLAEGAVMLVTGGLIGLFPLMFCLIHTGEADTS
jgi:hypothetical protein